MPVKQKCPFKSKFGFKYLCVKVDGLSNSCSNLTIGDSRNRLLIALYTQALFKLKKKTKKKKQLKSIVGNIYCRILWTFLKWTNEEFREKSKEIDDYARGLTSER